MGTHAPLGAQFSYFISLLLIIYVGIIFCGLFALISCLILIMGLVHGRIQFQGFIFAYIRRQPLGGKTVFIINEKESFLLCLLPFIGPPSIFFLSFDKSTLRKPAEPTLTYPSLADTLPQLGTASFAIQYLDLLSKPSPNRIYSG